MSYLTDENGKPLTKNGKLMTTPSSGISDVTINGKSIVTDGVAEIPIGTQGKPGVFGIPGAAYGFEKDNNNNIRLSGLVDNEINKRYYAKPLLGNFIDYAVKSAMSAPIADTAGMVDGVYHYPAWTTDEQAAARERMGAYQKDYRLIADVTLEQESIEIVVDKDTDGKDISLKKAKIFLFSPVPREDSKNTGYVMLNDNAIYYGAINWKMNGENSIAVVDIDTFGEIAPTLVRFSSQHIVDIAQTRQIYVSLGNILSYYNEINKIHMLSNYYFDIGTRIVILGKR